MSITYTISPWNEGQPSVDVTFIFEDKEYTRPVNAVVSTSGEYDHDATVQRVEEVAAGVEVKFNLNVITPAGPVGE